MSVIQIPKERKIFLAYPFTEFYNSNKIPELEAHMGYVINAIQKKGVYNVGFCSIFEEERYRKQGLNWDQIYEITQDEVKECGICVGWVPTSVHSKGRENEMIEAHNLGMPLHLIVQNDIDWRESHTGLINTIGDESLLDVIDYSELKTDLYETLSSYDFNKTK